MAKREQTVLVLQGGGALGAYQAGVYEGIAETGLNRFSAATAATFGVPGFFVPRQPPAFLAPEGTPEAFSVYDTSPLKETLQELVDFDLLNRKGAGLPPVAPQPCGSTAWKLCHQSLRFLYTGA